MQYQNINVSVPALGPGAACLERRFSIGAADLAAGNRAFGWFAYKGRPAARPAAPAKTPAPAPKDAPAPAPDAPKPPEPAKEAGPK